MSKEKNAGEKAFVQAEREIPEALYEKLYFFLGVGLVTYLSVKAGIRGNNEFSNLLLSALSASTIITGRLMDIYETQKVMKAQKKAVNLGMQPQYQEFNKLLPKEGISIKEFMKKPSTFILDTAVMMMSVMQPEVGFSVGLVGGFVGLSNARKAKRLDRTIELFNSNVSVQ